MEKNTILECPDYKVALTVKNDGALCCPDETCSKRNNCIYLYTKKNDFYWGEISREEMQHVCNILETKGYEEIIRYIVEKHPKLASYLLSDQRIDWLWGGLTPGRVSSCLDISSGWGVTTSLLSSVFKEVWSFEGVKERLRFQILKNKSLGVNNIKCLHGLLPKLPFKDNSFDLVTLNGVLELAGLIDKTISVRQNQLNLLIECKRVLSPGGFLYVGIENRVAQVCLRGGLDHCGLPYTSLMPRWLADIVVKQYNKRQLGYDARIRSVDNIDGYRTYTYTITGYERLMRQAGYGITDVRWVHPSYNNPRFVGPFQGDSFQRFFHDSPVTFGPVTGHRLNKLAAIPFLGGVLKTFTNSFIIFGWKDRKGGTLEELLFNNSKSYYRESARTKMIYYYWSKGQYEVVTVNRNLINRTQRGMTSIPDAVITRSPFNNEKPCYLYSLSDNIACIEWLKEFQNNKAAPARTRQEIQLEVDSVCDNALTLYGDALGKRLIDQIDKKKLVSILEKKSMHAYEHGDYWLGNILRSNDNKLHVIDFEHSRPKGDRLFDITHFVIRNLKTGRGSKETLFFNNFLGKGPYSSIFKKIVPPFLNEIGIPFSDWLYYVPYCILRIITCIDPGSGKWKWQNNYVEYTDIILSYSAKILTNEDSVKSRKR